LPNFSWHERDTRVCQRRGSTLRRGLDDIMVNSRVDRHRPA
jgi:hypothetical protein